MNDAGEPVEVQVSPSAVRDLDRIIELESVLREGKETDAKCMIGDCNDPDEAKEWADLYQSRVNEEWAEIRERMTLTFLPLVRKLVEARLLSISISNETLFADKTYISFCLDPSSASAGNCINVTSGVGRQQPKQALETDRLTSRAQA